MYFLNIRPAGLAPLARRPSSATISSRSFRQEAEPTVAFVARRQQALDAERAFGIVSTDQRKEHLMPTNAVRFHRVLRATPEKIYRAFLDADALAKWLPPHGFTCKVHQLDAKVGGVHKMS